MQTDKAPSRAQSSPCPNPAPPCTGPVALRGDESALYRAHHRALLASVRRVIRADEALIEDACQFAWLQLCRCQPERGETLFAWLRTVAIHEGYRLARLDARRRVPTRQRQNLQTGVIEAASLDMDDFVGSADLGRSVEARQALAAVAGLPKRQREYMALKIAGLSYQEIARLSGRTYANVTRHLAGGGRRTEAPPGAAQAWTRGRTRPDFAELLGLEEKRLVVGRVEGFELAVLPRRARKAAREARSAQ